MLRLEYLIVVLLLVKSGAGLFDPITAGLTAAVSVALGYNFDYVKEHTYCKVSECCIDKHIPADIDGLEEDLETHLFGQHIVLKQLIPALRGHFDKNRNPTKPLVISFQGTAGTGKTLVSDFIAKRLFKRGLESNFVYKFFGRADFPLESDSHIYRKDLNNKVREAVKSCPRSLFIFDEVHKIPPGVFESLASLLDHHTNINGVDFRKSVFLFLSNTGGVNISEKLAKLMGKGILRENTGLHHFENILEVGAYNLDGGLQRAGVIESSLIDHFIPFLPLEKKHVELCIKAEFKRLGAKPEDEEIENFIKNFVVFEESTGLFATAGCKRISKKMDIAIKSK